MEATATAGEVADAEEGGVEGDSNYITCTYEVAAAEGRGDEGHMQQLQSRWREQKEMGWMEAIAAAGEVAEAEEGRMESTTAAGEVAGSEEGAVDGGDNSCRI